METINCIEIILSSGWLVVLDFIALCQIILNELFVLETKFGRSMKYYFEMG